MFTGTINRELVERIVAAVGQAMRLSPGERAALTNSRSRGIKRIADARMVCIFVYSWYTSCTKEEAGAAFGRERTTAAHAIAEAKNRSDLRDAVKSSLVLLALGRSGGHGAASSV